jgi:hypothetical protein
MRRLGMIVALGTLLGMLGGVVTGTPALAGRGPKWEFLPAKPFTVPAAFCGFKVRVTFPVNKEYSKILKSSDGSMITLVTGALKVSYTNLSTGKSITVNESGPSKTTANPDGSAVIAFKGHTGFFLSPAQAKQFGLPTVSVTAGPITASFAADGSLTSVSFHGHVLTDVCAALS